MTVIKFREDQLDSVIKPGINNAFSRVYDAIVKYCLKENLPESAGRDELIFTTDTHEFFRGNGKGLDLIPFNTVLMYATFGDFPSSGVDSKIYVDKSTSLMFIWNGEAYESLSGGDGSGVIISPSDGKIGDLADLVTTDKENVVAAINEVFNALTVIDVDGVKSKVAALEVSMTDIQDSLLAIDIDEIIDLQGKIGDLSSLTTAEKTSIVGAINNLKTSITNLENKDVDFDEIHDIIGTLSSLVTANKTSVTAAINEVFNRTSNNEASIGNVIASITEVEDDVVIIENSVNVLNGTVADLDNSITQINTIIGDRGNLTTTVKSTLVGAINEIVSQVGSISSSDIQELKDAIGEIPNLDTTNKTNLVLAINELVANVTGISNSVSSLEGDVSRIDGEIADVVSDVGDLSSRTDSVEARMTSLENVNLTQEDKDNYLFYSDQVQALLDGMVPELQGRISYLEQLVATLQSKIESGSGGSGGDPDEEPGDPTTPPDDGEDEPAILWEHEFVLPVGVAVYELGDDPDWVNSGNTMDLMEDLFGDTQKVHLYSLGNANNPPTEPEEVPLVGMPGEAPTSHGVWESYTGEDIIFEVASLIAWRFRLVKYDK